MLRYGVIGTGGITTIFIDGVETTGLWELTAVYSRTQERGSEFGKHYGVDNVFTDLEEFASSDLFDAVYIASPNYLHYEQSKCLLEHGKHVICEKPFTSYLWQAKELFALAEEKNLVIMEAIMFMHQPNRSVLKDAVDSLGDISTAFFDNSKRSSKYDAYLAGDIATNFKLEVHAGALMDMGVYALYPALYFFGRPDSFHVDATFLPNGADGLGYITLKYADKLVSVRYSKVGEGVSGTDIHGANGSLRVGTVLHLGDITHRDNKGNETVLAKETKKQQIMAMEASDFYHFITDMEANKAFYQECKEMTLLVCEHLEACREKLGFPF